MKILSLFELKKYPPVVILTFLLLILLAIPLLQVNVQDLNSRAGDEAALEALAGSLSGLGSGWSTSGMSLDNTIDGVTVETIGGELRVTRLNLKGRGLTGHIDVPEIGNLKELTYLNLFYNNLTGNIPGELGSCTNLVYLYLNSTDGYETEDPHEAAQTGGGDVHPGKSDAPDSNNFTGAVPPELGNLTNLKWLILNWTDTAVDKFDGISSVPVELFDIAGLVGLQIFNNNNIADLPFPKGIVHMANLDNLALGVGKSSHNNHGWVTGSVPGEFTNLSNLRYVRLGENPTLTIDFDVVDFSGLTSLRNFDAPFIDAKGNFPSSFLDGTYPEFTAFNFNWPKGADMTGTFSSGSTEMQIVLVTGHNLSGTIPAGFWNNVELINTDFSYNSFTSIGTDDLTALGSQYWKIRNLRWSHNEISGRWPNLAWGTSQLNDLSRVQYDNNKYVFSDMLWVPGEYNPEGKPIFELYQGLGLSTFSYSPQKPFGSAASEAHSVGADITLDNFDTVVTHADNAYQWQKDGSDIAGATSRSLAITDAQTTDSGTYTLKVTNPGVSDLTLTSEKIELTIN